jgi:hypothetical protein
MNELAPEQFLLHVGIDIASKKASVAWLTAAGQVQPAFEIPLTPVGMAGLRQRLLAVESDAATIHTIMEVTANYWSDRLAVREIGYTDRSRSIADDQLDRGRTSPSRAVYPPG